MGNSKSTEIAGQVENNSVTTNNVNTQQQHDNIQTVLAVLTFALVVVGLGIALVKTLVKRCTQKIVREIKREAVGSVGV